MKIVSWNVNGINACTRKGMLEFMTKEGADVYCFQELKSSIKTINPKLMNLNDYHSYFFFAEKNGYSGVAVYSKVKPLKVTKGIGVEKFDREGRVLTLEYPEFILINAYFPHSSRDLHRLKFKLEFNKAFEKHVKRLKKPYILAGDFNVAHTKDDLANPKQNVKNAGFRPEERKWFTNFLKGRVDTFREFTKGNGHYTWWTYRTNARERNIGWRIDYFIVPSGFKVKNSEILSKVMGSDHCPIKLTLAL